MLYFLSACRTSDSLQTQSQLHDVSDTEHTFRLAPVDRSQYVNYSLIGDEERDAGDEEGDPNAIMRFEMCLNDASANPMPQTCFNAFHNHLGEPIFFTIDAVSKAALTPEEMSYVSGLERSWESFRRDSKEQSRDKETIVIGASVVAAAIVRRVVGRAWRDGEEKEIDKQLAEVIQGLKKNFGVSKLAEVPGARKTLGIKVSLRQIYDEDFLVIIARKAKPFLEAQNVDLNKALSVPKLYLDGINAPGVVAESLEEFMKLAPDQNISRIVKPRYQKHFLEYVSAKQYFIPDTQKLWVPLRGDAQKRLGQMNEFFNKLVKQPLSMSNAELAPTSTILHNVMEFVVHRGQLPRLSQARLVIRAYQRGGLRALSKVSENAVDGLKLLGISRPPKKTLRGLFRKLFTVRSLALVSIGAGVRWVAPAVVERLDIQKDRLNDDDNPDLVPKEGLGDLGITPGNVDTFTIMADLGSALTSNEKHIRVKSAESVVRHVARYLERTGFSQSDTSIAYVCLPKQGASEHDGSLVYDRGWFFRKCYEDWDSREEAT